MTTLQEQNDKLQQLSTKEHDDTTTAFALMRKDIEQLRTEKYVCSNNEISMGTHQYAYSLCYILSPLYNCKCCVLG